MRKTVIDPATVHSDSRTEQEWFDLEEMAKVEVTSEDPGRTRSKISPDLSSPTSIPEHHNLPKIQGDFSGSLGRRSLCVHAIS